MGTSRRAVVLAVAAAAAAAAGLAAEAEARRDLTWFWGKGTKDHGGHHDDDGRDDDHRKGTGGWGGGSHDDDDDGHWDVKKGRYGDDDDDAEGPGGIFEFFFSTVTETFFEWDDDDDTEGRHWGRKDRDSMDWGYYGNDGRDYTKDKKDGCKPKWGMFNKGKDHHYGHSWENKKADAEAAKQARLEQARKERQERMDAAAAKEAAMAEAAAYDATATKSTHTEPPAGSRVMTLEFNATGLLGNLAGVITECFDEDDVDAAPIASIIDVAGGTTEGGANTARSSATSGLALILDGVAKKMECLMYGFFEDVSEKDVEEKIGDQKRPGGPPKCVNLTDGVHLNGRFHPPCVKENEVVTLLGAFGASVAADGEGRAELDATVPVAGASKVHVNLTVARTSDIVLDDLARNGIEEVDDFPNDEGEPESVKKSTGDAFTTINVVSIACAAVALVSAIVSVSVYRSRARATTAAARVVAVDPIAIPASAIYTVNPDSPPTKIDTWVGVEAAQALASAAAADPAEGKQ